MYILPKVGLKKQELLSREYQKLFQFLLHCQRLVIVQLVNFARLLVKLTFLCHGPTIVEIAWGKFILDYGVEYHSRIYQ